MTAQKKFLDLTGVQYLVQAIKGIVSDINTAISSKANDSEVLHKAQTETVTGEKTFKKDVKIIDLNANERPGVKFEVNGSFRTFEQAKDSLPDPDFGDFGGGTLWDGGFLADNTKIQNSMGDYVINDITFGTTNYSSVIEFNNYYKVTYEDGHNSPEDVTGMLRFELAPYENVEKDHGYWSDPDLYFYAMLDGSFSGGSTILGNPRAPWSKAYIGEINCEDIKFGGFFSIFDALKNIQKLSYVTHYSSTALTPSSTNSNTLLDNTDNLKVGDKVIDASGVIYSVTAIDTANSTFTIGTSLIDLAQDSDVVHKSGNETVSGQKTFDSNTYVYNSDNTATTPNLILKNSKSSKGSTSETGAQLLKFVDKNNSSVGELESIVTTNGASELRLSSNTLDSNNQNVKTGVTLITNTNGAKRFCPTSNDDVFLGASTLKWSRVYSTNYYYGNDNVEFSTKFVTTDTAQTVTGSKTFRSNVNVYNSDNTADTPNIILKNSKVERGSTTNTGEQNISFLDKNNAQIGNIKCITNSSGVSNMYISCNASGSDRGVRLSRSPSTTYFRSIADNDCKLGTTDVRWSDVQTYKVNALEPSSLSLPSDRSARIDISSYITNLGNGNNNQYIVPANGYIWLHFTSINGVLCFSQTSGGLTNYAQTFNRYQGDGLLYAFFPVRKDDNFVAQIYTSSTAVVQNAYFIPCLGNV